MVSFWLGPLGLSLATLLATIYLGHWFEHHPKTHRYLFLPTTATQLAFLRLWNVLNHLLLALKINLMYQTAYRALLNETKRNEILSKTYYMACTEITE